MLARFALIAFILGGLLVPGIALGNPTFLENFSYNQVADTMHVHIKYGSLTQANMTLPSSAQRDGVRSSISSGVYTGRLDNGSGEVDFDFIEFCDCNVPAGVHEYHTVYGDEVSSRERSFEVTDPPPTEGGAGTNVDCVAECDRLEQIEVVEEQEEQEEDGGCSVHRLEPTRSSVPIAAIVVLAFGACAMARRRS